MRTRRKPLKITVLALLFVSLFVGSGYAATEISSVPFTISSSGAYVVTQNLNSTSSNSNAININADHVTLDLGGYSIIGQRSSNSNGIYISAQSNVRILNGVVRGFGGNGIFAEDMSRPNENHQVINVRAIGNRVSGIDLEGIGHLVQGSFAVENGNEESEDFSIGIAVGFNSVIKSCHVQSNPGGVGVLLGPSCTIVESKISDHFFGLVANDHCTVKENHVADSFSGIVLFGENGHCLIKGNVSERNVAANIDVSGSGNVIEANFVSSAVEAGIVFQDPGNFYANNRALNNGVGFENTAGNKDGGGNVSF